VDSLGALLQARAQKYPSATALFCGERRISYRELDESSSRLAVWLLERGLQRGDRVAIHWCNSIETVQLFFAIFKAGLIAVPINLRLKAPEAAWILQHSQALLCFSEPTLAPITEEARASCPALGSILTQLPEAETESSSPLPEIKTDQPAIILYTSGSTARPKGATHSHRTLLAGLQLVADNFLVRDDIVLVTTQMMDVRRRASRCAIGGCVPRRSGSVAASLRAWRFSRYGRALPVYLHGCVAGANAVGRGRTGAPASRHEFSPHGDGRRR
jgi:acyl-CoA synthetase (AMP-forming)/AMP-acid ligase II